MRIQTIKKAPEKLTRNYTPEEIVKIANESHAMLADDTITDYEKRSYYQEMIEGFKQFFQWHVLRIIRQHCKLSGWDYEYKLCSKALSDKDKLVPVSLSVIMIVKDEAHTLRRCLDSLKGQYDELIIVDTGSTDDTIKIANEYTDKVFSHTIIPFDFSVARNMSLQHATKDWIYIIDADEELVAGGSSIKRMIASCVQNGKDCIRFKFYNKKADEWVEGYTNNRILQRKKVNFMKIEHKDSHNVIRGNFDNRSIYYSDTIIMRHYGYDQHSEKGKARNLQTLEMCKNQIEKMKEAGTTSGVTWADVHFNIARNYINIGEFDKVLDALMIAYNEPAIGGHLDLRAEIIGYVMSSLYAKNAKSKNENGNILCTLEEMEKMIEELAKLQDPNHAGSRYWMMQQAIMEQNRDAAIRHGKAYLKGCEKARHAKKDMLHEKTDQEGNVRKWLKEQHGK